MVIQSVSGEEIHGSFASAEPLWPPSRHPQAAIPPPGPWAGLKCTPLSRQLGDSGGEAVDGLDGLVEEGGGGV